MTGCTPCRGPMFPSASSLGGMNWGSLSTDPNNHYIFVNDMRLGLWVQLIKQDPQSAVANTGGEAVNAGMGRSR